MERYNALVLEGDANFSIVRNGSTSTLGADDGIVENVGCVDMVGEDEMDGGFDGEVLSYPLHHITALMLSLPYTTGHAVVCHSAGGLGHEAYRWGQ